jgi:hypothetical protein
MPLVAIRHPQSIFAAYIMTFVLPVPLRHCAYLMSVLVCPLRAVAGEAPAAVYGQYAGAGCAREQARSSNPVCTTSSDAIQITRSSDGSAAVSVRIVFGQGNACQLDGNADWRDDAFVLRSGGLEGGCGLVIRIRGTAATLEDEGARCQPYYCGARGVFSGARFNKRR